MKMMIYPKVMFQLIQRKVSFSKRKYLYYFPFIDQPKGEKRKRNDVNEEDDDEDDRPKKI